MMSSLPALFVDTAGWADPVLQNTSNHQAMMAFARQFASSRRRLVTTNYVINELVALLTARAHSISRAELIDLVDHITASQDLELIHIDPPTHSEAWALLARATDKEWSLVDAASFVVMRRLGISEAFTSDHHFTQAGFIQVP